MAEEDKINNDDDLDFDKMDFDEPEFDPVTGGVSLRTNGKRQRPKQFDIDEVNFDAKQAETKVIGENTSIVPQPKIENFDAGKEKDPCVTSLIFMKATKTKKTIPVIVELYFVSDKVFELIKNDFDDIDKLIDNIFQSINKDDLTKRIKDAILADYEKIAKNNG